MPEVMREVVHAMCDEAAAQLTLHSLATIGKGTRVSHMEHRQQNVWAQKHHERVQQSSHDFTSDHAQRNTFDQVLYTMCWLAYCVHIKATKQFHTKHGAHQEHSSLARTEEHSTQEALAHTEEHSTQEKVGAHRRAGHQRIGRAEGASA